MRHDILIVVEQQVISKRPEFPSSTYSIPFKTTLTHPTLLGCSYATLLCCCFYFSIIWAFVAASSIYALTLSVAFSLWRQQQKHAISICKTNWKLPRLLSEQINFLAKWSSEKSAQFGAFASSQRRFVSACTISSWGFQWDFHKYINLEIIIFHSILGWNISHSWKFDLGYLSRNIMSQVAVVVVMPKTLPK